MSPSATESLSPLVHHVSRFRRRVRVDVQHLEDAADSPENAAMVTAVCTSSAAVWMYVPETHERPTSDFPVVQTYLDVVLNGCMQWGGVSAAEEFIRTTGGWSEYFLNDTPLGRRPWLNRLNYQLIDQVGVSATEGSESPGTSRHTDRGCSSAVHPAWPSSVYVGGRWKCLSTAAPPHRDRSGG